MSVTLRKKFIKKETQISFRLDINHNSERWIETLGIYINRYNQTEADREKKKIAEQIRIKREKELLVDGHGLPNKVFKRVDFMAFFYQLSQERKTCKNYLNSYNKAVEFLSGRKMNFQAITVKWLREFKDYLLTQVSTNTAREYYIKLYATLDEAERRGLVAKNPMKELDKATDYIKEAFVDRTAYTPEQIVQLANSDCGISSKYRENVPQYRMAYLLSCFCGLRWSDVNNLEWDRISIYRDGDVTEYYLNKTQKKTGNEVLIPLGPNAVAIIEERIRQRELELESNYVFPLAKEVEGTKRVYARVWWYMKKWAEAAGFDPKKMHFHNSRHTFATNAIRYAKTDLVTLASLLGQTSTRSTIKYTKVSPEMRRVAVNAMPVLDLKKSA